MMYIICTMNDVLGDLLRSSHRSCNNVKKEYKSKSNRKAMNRNWAIKSQIPLLKQENKKNYKYTKYNDNIWLTERAAISQKVATQQPKQ